MNSGSAPAFGCFHGAAHVTVPHSLQGYFRRACQVSKCIWEKAENVFGVTGEERREKLVSGQVHFCDLEGACLHRGSVCILILLPKYEVLKQVVSSV